MEKTAIVKRKEKSEVQFWEKYGNLILPLSAEGYHVEQANEGISVMYADLKRENETVQTVWGMLYWLRKLFGYTIVLFYSKLHVAHVYAHLELAGELVVYLVQESFLNTLTNTCMSYTHKSCRLELVPRIPPEDE